MNVLLSGKQTSGYDWNTRGGSRLYHRQRFNSPRMPVIQLAELAHLEDQMARYREDHRKIIETLRSLYVFQDDATISQFLQSHKTVAPVLAEAERHLRQFFGDAILVLRSTTDDQGWDMLYATVQWPGEPADAVIALNAFDNAWWLANSYPVGSNLTLTYRLV